MNSILLFWLDCALKSTVVLAAAAVTALLLRRAPAASRHLVWLSGLCIAVTLPILQSVSPAQPLLKAPAPAVQQQTPKDDLTLPTESIDLATLALLEKSLPQTPAPEPAPKPTNPGPIIALVWLIGSGCLFAYSLLGWMVVTIVSRRATACMAKPDNSPLLQRMGIRRAVRVGINRDVIPPTAMTWGAVRPTVLLPKTTPSWPGERITTVLLHEFAHIRRMDFLCQAVATMACAMYWFNPAVWLAARALRAEAESAADDLVIQRGTAPSTYASDLLSIAAELGRVRSPFAFPGVNVMKSSKIERRIEAILDPKRSHRGATRLQALLATGLAACLLFAGGGVRAFSFQAPADQPAVTQFASDSAVTAAYFQQQQKKTASKMGATSKRARARSAREERRRAELYRRYAEIEARMARARAKQDRARQEILAEEAAQREKLLKLRDRMMADSAKEREAAMKEAAQARANADRLRLELREKLNSQDDKEREAAMKEAAKMRAEAEKMRILTAVRSKDDARRVEELMAANSKRLQINAEQLRAFADAQRKSLDPEQAKRLQELLKASDKNQQARLKAMEERFRSFDQQSAQRAQERVRELLQNSQERQSDRLRRMEEMQRALGDKGVADQMNIFRSGQSRISDQRMREIMAGVRRLQAKDLERLQRIKGQWMQYHSADEQRLRDEMARYYKSAKPTTAQRKAQISGAIEMLKRQIAALQAEQAALDKSGKPK
ncbi:MAG TPA: M56 family metallopeptidase [Fimbriimonas sp.]|nr:M56 family metallopeptidase [Fimbriimonas sp.]